MRFLSFEKCFHCGFGLFLDRLRQSNPRTADFLGAAVTSTACPQFNAPSWPPLYGPRHFLPASTGADHQRSIPYKSLCSHPCVFDPVKKVSDMVPRCSWRKRCDNQTQGQHTLPGTATTPTARPPSNPPHLVPGYGHRNLLGGQTFLNKCLQGILTKTPSWSPMRFLSLKECFRCGFAMIFGDKKL